jgi:hypothetical protein
MDKDNLEVLNDCVDCGISESNTNSTQLPIDTGYRPMPLPPMFDFDLKYVYLKNITYNKEKLYTNSLEPRKDIAKTNQDNASNIILQYDNVGDKYTDEELFYLDKIFVEKNNFGTNVVNINYNKLQDNSLELIPNYYRILPEKRIILDNELNSYVDSSFSYFVDSEFGNPETIYPIGTFFRVANGVSVSSACDQQVYFVTKGNCVCSIPNTKTLQVMLVERNKYIQGVFVIEPSEFESFEITDSCADKTSEWIPRFEIDSGCKTPDLEIDLSALDRIQIPKLPDVIQGAAGAAGTAGAAGAAGAAGPAGAAGSAGAAGKDGKDGKCPDCEKPTPTPTTTPPTTTPPITARPTQTPTPTPIPIDSLGCKCYSILNDDLESNEAVVSYTSCSGEVTTISLLYSQARSICVRNGTSPVSNSNASITLSSKTCTNNLDCSSVPTPTETTTTSPTTSKYYELAGCDNSGYAYTTIPPSLGVGQRYIDPISGVLYTYTGARPLEIQPSRYNGSIQIVTSKQYCSNSDITNPTTPPPAPTPTVVVSSNLSYNLYACGTTILSGKRIPYTGTYSGGEVIKASNGICYTVAQGNSSEESNVRVLFGFSTCSQCSPVPPITTPPITARPTPTPEPTPIPTSEPSIVDCECYDGYITDDLGFNYEDCYGNRVANTTGREINNPICFNIKKPYSSNIQATQLSENCSCGGLFNPTIPTTPEVPSIGTGTTSGENGNTSDVLPPNELRIDNFR